ncbi:MAG: potassium channel family protein [Chloroflexota bacterium]
MRVIIVGCGRVGASVANLLSTQGHQVAVIDRNPQSFARLRESFTGLMIEGNAFDPEVLRQAGIEKADGFATLTAGDNTNYILAMLARTRFRVPRVVTRIYDPQRADIYRRLGVPTISSTVWAANRIQELLSYLGLTSVLTIANGEVEVVEVEVGPMVEGHQVKDLNVPGEIEVVSITRGGSAFIPLPSSTIARHDLLHIAALSTALPRLEAMLSPA